MVLDKIIALVAEHFQMDEEDLSEDTLFAEVGADDMDIADLVMTVEDEFDMDFEDTGLVQVSTVAEALEYLEAQK